MGWLGVSQLHSMFAERILSRIAYGGADLGECLSTLERIGDADSEKWYDEWLSTAERIAAIGDSCIAAGHLISGREALFRATSYYQAAYFPLFGKPVDPRLTKAFEQETRTFHKAAMLNDYPIEVLQIKFEDTYLPAYFVKVDNSLKPRPTLLHTNGYDSNIQEMFYNHAPAAIRRGYNCILLDGPGQGSNLIKAGIPLRPNWESVITPIVDYLFTRPEVDINNLILVGWSFGGYLAPRACAFEKRFAALIADPGHWDLSDSVYSMVQSLPLSQKDKRYFPDIDKEKFNEIEAWLRDEKTDSMLRWKLIQRGFWVHDVDNLYDYLVSLLNYELSPIVDQITCPTLLTFAENDPLATGVAQLYEALKAPKTLLRFTQAEGSGGHCESMARTLYHQRVFDWLDELLKRGSSNRIRS